MQRESTPSDASTSSDTSHNAREEQGTHEAEETPPEAGKEQDTVTPEHEKETPSYGVVLTKIEGEGTSRAVVYPTGTSKPSDAQEATRRFRDKWVLHGTGLDQLTAVRLVQTKDIYRKAVAKPAIFDETKGLMLEAPIQGVSTMRRIKLPSALVAGFFTLYAYVGHVQVAQAQTFVLQGDSHPALQALAKYLHVDKDTGTVTIKRTPNATPNDSITDKSNITNATNMEKVVFSGLNVHIQSGAGATDAKVNGKGNLLIGYNEHPSASQADRTGSHNLVIGAEHAYSSFGGLLAGKKNTLTGPHSSITGGTNNTISGSNSSISGGSSGEITSDHASISGGASNKVGGDYSSISGGSGNKAFGRYTSVSGGQDNIAGNSADASLGWYSSISGGAQNRAYGRYTSIGGGQSNRTGDSTDASLGWYSSISGGDVNTTTGDYSSISGGQSNKAHGRYSSISGGWNNITGTSGLSPTSGKFASISGGKSNQATGEASSISGGGHSLAKNGNVASGLLSTIVGGEGNHATGDTSSILGGEINKTTGRYSSISGGYANVVQSQSSYSSILGGNGQTTTKSHITIPSLP